MWQESVISEMVERRSLVFRIICVVTRWHIGLKFQNHGCSVAHSYSNSMDKQQVIDGKQLIIMYVTALCVRVSVCKSQYGIWEYSCMDAFSEIVALCLIHYIRYRHLMFRYWYPRSGWGEKKIKTSVQLPPVPSGLFCTWSRWRSGQTVNISASLKQLLLSRTSYLKEHAKDLRNSTCKLLK